MGENLREAVRSKWIERLEQWERLGVMINGASVARELLADLSSLDADERSVLVTLRDAHAIGGYTTDHLQRLVASGRLPNFGRKGRPRIRFGDVPVKPGWKPLRSDSDDAVLAERRRIVASVVTGGDS